MENGSKQSGMNPMFVGAVLLVVLVGGGFMLLSGNKSQQPSSNTNQQATDTVEFDDDSTTIENDNDGDNPVAVVGTKTVNVEAGMFYFKPTEIRVKKGDKVKIVLKNEEGMHDWAVDEFNVRTKTLKAGETDTVEFTANKAGTFEYYCSVGNHRAMGMVGKLIVE